MGFSSIQTLSVERVPTSERTGTNPNRLVCQTGTVENQLPHIHTDAIKQEHIPAEVTANEASIIYADEADMLNVAMFGMTAKMWREQHPELKGNIAGLSGQINELICLSNMENLNAVFIDQGIPQGERLIKLNQIAIHQMGILENGGSERNLLK